MDISSNCLMVSKPNNTEKVFNSRLETLRVKKDISQEALGQSADIEKSYFSRLLGSAEKPRTDPNKKRWNIDHINDLSQALNVPAWQLFIDPREVIPPEYLQLMEDYKGLDPLRKQIVDDAFAASRLERGKKSNGQNGSSKASI